MAARLNLTRDQLASFLSDPEQIRQFELLFATTSTTIPSTIDEVSIEAGNAQASAYDALTQIVALSQESAISSALAESRANQALALIDQLSKAVDGLQMTPPMEQLDRLVAAIEGLQMLPPPREFKRARYGSFFDTTTQTATVINTATAVTFNNTDLSNGVSIGSPNSRIIVDQEGLYNFALSFQIDKTSGGVAEFYIWFRLNGVNVANSAGLIRIQGNNAEIFSAYNIFLELKSTDYVEIMFSVSDLSVELLAVSAVAPVPAIPSIILTVNNNIEGVI